MPNEATYAKALGSLRVAALKVRPGQGDYEKIVASREEVFARYRPIFSTDHIPVLSKEEYTSFLYFKNNRHWTQLNRKGLRATDNMDTLRKALAGLLDEGKPIAERLPWAIDMVNGLGKATATGILTVAYPKVYGVWNNTSESALRELGIWPDLKRGEDIGTTYGKVNSLLTQLRTDLEIDFWTLDVLWWYLPSSEGSPDASDDLAQPYVNSSCESQLGFMLEKHLENFLLENWDLTELGVDWSIYSKDGDAEAGNQFPTDIGKVDILAVHKTEPRMLVIELKRDQTSDQTVGQVLRYIGWIDKHVAKPLGKTVEGLVIGRGLDKSILYALSTLNHVKVMTYEIEFRLKHPNELQD